VVKNVKVFEGKGRRLLFQELENVHIMATSPSYNFMKAQENNPVVIVRIGSKYRMDEPNVCGFRGLQRISCWKGSDLANSKWRSHIRGIMYCGFFFFFFFFF